MELLPHQTISVFCPCTATATPRKETFSSSERQTVISYLNRSFGSRPKKTEKKEEKKRPKRDEIVVKTCFRLN
jgi:hypothetical protein